MKQRLRYARQQAANALAQAEASSDDRLRGDWLKAARLWEELAHECEILLGASEIEAA